MMRCFKTHYNAWTVSHSTRSCLFLCHPHDAACIMDMFHFCSKIKMVIFWRYFNYRGDANQPLKIQFYTTRYLFGLIQLFGVLMWQRICCWSLLWIIRSVTMVSLAKIAWSTQKVITTNINRQLPQRSVLYELKLKIFLILYNYSIIAASVLAHYPSTSLTSSPWCK